MHKITWTGKLAQWENFREDVSAKVREPWSPTVIDLALESRDLKQEQVLVADELGVRGRFQQAVGQVLGTVFQAELVNIRFADFKAAGVPYSKTPDVAMVPREGSASLKALGEIKVPWVDGPQAGEADCV
ncbi:uncharacterized protein N7518_001694 [Penicillium psychrosexuale]|uniref:uncharacterized protein n=1 Tax=Penicillium psychrosexuale TaxID=1002107 RepID=UPI002545530A|nr:uncharacterized protein N7518_001694 [Penicillium psychrosexuale]KAJ5799626.1 hypothetical protein N7518_001694 [Penicillium psychrosexuale]